jgi:hypothetical protein
VSVDDLPQLVRHGAAELLSIPDRVASLRPPTFEHLRSQLPSAAQGDHPRFRGWLTELGFDDTPRFRYDRKVWEWCFILEAFQQRGLLAPGRRALAFGVGRERLPAILASRGVAVVATDQAAETAGSWATAGQHAAALDELRYDEVCPSARFERFVTFRPVDMTAIPDDLRDFDMVWSSCAFEHLGSAAAGADFVLRSMDCLRPGGTAVHTTEARVDGGPDLELDGVVLYSVATLRRLLARLRLQGHMVLANYKVPNEGEADRFVDEPPYPHEPYHLKLRVGNAVSSSFGIVVRKRPGR